MVFLQQNFPHRFKTFASDQNIGAWKSAECFSGDRARNRLHFHFRTSNLAQRPQLDSSELTDYLRRARPFERQRSITLRFIRERDVIHNDEFVERLDQSLANHSIRNAEKFGGLSARFDFGEDATLRIQQQRDTALRRLKIFDVVGQNSVEIARPVRAGERNVRSVALVDQRDALFR